MREILVLNFIPVAFTSNMWAVGPEYMKAHFIIGYDIVFTGLGSISMNFCGGARPPVDSCLS